jgi:hypothetical protein
VRARLGAAVRRYLAGVRVATAGLANGDVLWDTVAAAIRGKGDRDVVIALDREGEHSRADLSRQPVEINRAVQYSLVHSECMRLAREREGVVFVDAYKACCCCICFEECVFARSLARCLKYAGVTWAV